MKATRVFQNIYSFAKCVTVILLLGLLSQPSCSSQSGGGGTTAKYVILGWNNLGMHCYNPDFEHVGVLPPYNTLIAQVIKVGDPPQIVKWTAPL